MNPENGKLQYLPLLVISALAATMLSHQPETSSPLKKSPAANLTEDKKASDTKKLDCEKSGFDLVKACLFLSQPDCDKPTVSPKNEDGDQSQPAQKENTEVKGSPPKIDEATRIAQRFRYLKTEAEQLSESQPPIKHLALRIILVTVPDPIDSHVPSSFDSCLGALQLAAQQHKFLLDRYYLPWEESLKALKDLESKESSEHREASTLHRRQPGALLFRREQKSSAKDLTTEFVLALLVGETPSSGVHRLAWIDAVQHWAAWHETAEKYRTAQKVAIIPVLGPTFSGSAFSLRRSMQEFDKNGIDFDVENLSFQFISGAATSPSVAKLLNVCDRSPASTFHATVIPDDLVAEEMVKYLTAQRHIAESQLAMLVEEGTTYGASLLDNQKILELPYPREIASLRSEYAKLPKKESPSPQAGLNLSSEISKSATDVLPVFSTDTIAITEQKVATILSTLSQRRIRFVGISGTDVRDHLFLIEAIRKNAPSVEVFSLDPHLLYAQRRWSRLTTGMLVASTYPLFVDSQSWTRWERPCVSGRREIEFSSMTAEGTYNAAIALLNVGDNEDVQPLVDYSHPFNDQQPGDRRMTPAVWLTIIGAQAMFPVDVRRIDRNKLSEHHVYLPATEGAIWPAVQTIGVRPSIMYPFFSTVAALLCGVGFYLLEVRKSELSWLADRSLPFAPLPTSIGESEQQSFFGATMASTFFMAMLAIHFAFSLPLWSSLIGGFWSNGHWLEGILYWAIMALSVLAVPVMFFCGCSCLLTALRNRPETSRRQYCSLLGPFPLLLLIVTLLFLYGRLDRRLASAIYVVRYGEFGSGVSPLVPTALLGAASLVWACYHLNRLQFLARMPLTKFFGNDSDDEKAPPPGIFISGLRYNWNSLQDKIERPMVKFWQGRFRDLIVLVIFWLSLVVVGVMMWNGTDEGAPFNLALTTAAICLQVTISLIYARISLILTALVKFVRRIDHHPFVVAFSEVPDVLSMRVAQQFFVLRPRMENAATSLQILRQFRPLRGKLRDLQQRLVKILEVKEPDENETYTSRQAKFLADLDEVAAEEFSDLEQIWQLRKPTMSSLQPGQKPPEITPAELFVATRVTAALRKVFWHLRLMMTALVVMLLLFLWFLNSYPFRSWQLFTLGFYLLTIWIAVNFAAAFVRLNMSEVISRLGNTTPNRLSVDRSLVVAMLTYVVIPIMSLLAVQFPSVGDSLFFWTTHLQKILQG